VQKALRYVEPFGRGSLVLWTRLPNF